MSSRYLLPVVAAAGLLAAGCGTDTVEGDPTTPTTVAAPEPFNVCQDLPDSALQAAGLDPSTKDVVTDPPSGPSSWRVCAWDPAGMPPPVTYVVELYSTSHTMEETRNTGRPEMAFGSGRHHSTYRQSPLRQ
ncbi:DUF3558 family protein [Nocardia carnea]|uniref:DUF3558 family protein n=1 Tax=Nocardia carnea TaxID=37328 RepID=UPI002458CD8C|nr:DUF3558 family protein [Nocardia carnea]